MSSHPSPFSGSIGRRHLLAGAAGLAGAATLGLTPTQAEAKPKTWTPGIRPFKKNSPWNTPVSKHASYAPIDWYRKPTEGFWINWNQYSPSVYVSSKSDPLRNVVLPTDTWGYKAGIYPIHIPVDAVPAVGTDGEIVIVEGTTVHNMWQYNPSDPAQGGQPSCAAYARCDVYKDSGWGWPSPFRGAGITAAGASELAGLLVQAETDRGEIEHALQLVVDWDYNSAGFPDAFVPPAISADNPTGRSVPEFHFLREGERYAIPKGTAMPDGLSPLGQKVFRAFTRYGAYNVDSSYGAVLIRVQANAYDGATMMALGYDMGKLIPLLQHVVTKH